MDEFISIIQFRSAMPFGYLLFTLVWLSVVAWSLKNILSNLLGKKFYSPRLYITGSLLVVCIGYVIASVKYSENINMNPFFNESDLVGEWNYGSSNLVLKPDGTAEINLSKSLLERLDIDNGEVYWRKKGDFNLVLWSNEVNFVSNNRMLRVIEYADKYRLIIEDYDDLDMWDGSLGFKQKNK